MKNNYILCLRGSDAVLSNLSREIGKFADYKENYKNWFNYPLGLRTNWFGFLLLPLVAYEENQIAIIVFSRLLKDKKVRKVYVQSIEKIRVSPQKQEWVLKFTAYDTDMHYLIKVMGMIFKMHNIECDSVFY